MLNAISMSLPRTSWVMLNRLRIGVGCFHSSMYKWSLAPSPNCECGAIEQTSDHAISSCLMYQEEHKVCRFWMTQLNCWLNTTTASI